MKIKKSVRELNRLIDRDDDVVPVSDVNQMKYDILKMIASKVHRKNPLASQNAIIDIAMLKFLEKYPLTIYEEQDFRVYLAYLTEQHYYQ